MLRNEIRCSSILRRLPVVKKEETMLIIQKKRKISSRWEMETGDWDSTKNIFVNYRTTISEKEIEMGIINKDGRKILRFNEMPRGYALFYIDYLKRNLRKSDCNELCICDGTINKCAACYVKKSDILQYLEDCE